MDAAIGGAQPSGTLRATLVARRARFAQLAATGVAVRPRDCKHKLQVRQDAERSPF